MNTFIEEFKNNTNSLKSINNIPLNIGVKEISNSEGMSVTCNISEQDKDGYRFQNILSVKSMQC